MVQNKKWGSLDVSTTQFVGRVYLCIIHPSIAPTNWMEIFDSFYIVWL